MASLVQQHDHYYLQFYSKHRRPRQKRIALRLQTKRDAERLRRKLERDYALGDFDPWTDDPLSYERTVVRPETLGEAADAFFRSRSHLATRTQQEYRKIVSRLVSFVGTRTLVSLIDAEHIQRWLDTTEAGDVTRHNYTRHLKVFFRWARGEGLTDVVAPDGVRLRRIPQKFPRYLSREEVEAVTDEAARLGKDWLADLVVFAAHTGLRRGELVHLRWTHVNLPAQRLTVANTDAFSTKSGADRMVPLSGAAVEVLCRRREATDANGYVFTHSQGQIDPDYLSKCFKRAARGAGIHDVHLHHLRHTACSWLAEQGVPVEVIRRFAGHSTITVTEKYMHVSQDAVHQSVLRALG